MSSETSRGIWVFAEQQNGKIHPVTLELLAKAQELKTHSDEQVTAVLLGSGVEKLARSLIAYGADQVIAAEHQALAEYSARPYQKAVAQLAEKYRPSIILYGATSQGRDLAPRVMVSLHTGLTADAIDLGYDEDGVFYQTTPAYGGSILAHIVILDSRPQMATVRPKIFAPLEPDATRKGQVLYENVEVEGDECYEVISRAPLDLNETPIDRSPVLVCGGRGVKSNEELEMLRQLAELLGGQLASSRPLVDSGMLPHSRQVGQSGTTVKPDLIVNVAISGSVQYQIGMQDSKCIVSINHTVNAPIFDISHYGITEDFKTVIPAIIEEIEMRRSEDAK